MAKATFPNLDKNAANWKFLQYLIFGTFDDDDTGRRIISQKIIAEIEGRLDQINNYRAATFLESFQRDVMGPDHFQWREWMKNKCRQVTKCEFPPDFAKAVEDEMQKVNHDEGRVYFADGTYFSRAKERIDRNRRKEAALAVQDEAICDEAREILDYMNNLPPNLFSAIRENIEQAMIVAAALPDGKKGKKVSEIQQKYLKRIADQPQPFYSPSKKGSTVRIFGVDGCITSLQRDVRKALTVCWHEADIKSSQLAICAKLWHVEAVERFLDDGGNIWHHLYDEMQIPPAKRSDIKPALKEGVYSTCYGMPESSIKGNLTKALRAKEIDQRGQSFTESPLIGALLLAREEAMALIEVEGGAETCFGDFLPTYELDEKQILAQVAQAVELKLVHPVIRLAMTTDDFKVVLWQHDGFSVHFTRRPGQWLDRISEVVQDQVDELGIKTRLEWDG
ncbi:MAG: hypothetical protein WCD79_08015 [Chthoniobacteraceae bacterium]